MNKNKESIFSSWSQVYALVIGALFLEIVIFYFITLFLK